MMMNPEFSRLENPNPWRKWGPYLSERQWGSVREDYSAEGDAWNYVSHDLARSYAYRWGEDGIGGISDDRQKICLALGLWNGNDPILKERLFGLTNFEGNHGEDVKELYYYLDNTPTHSYMKMLYKYPHEAFPYDRLVAENRQKSRSEREFELIETGIFGGDRYFDVVIESAKNDVEDLLVRYTVINRGGQAAEIHVLPTVWFRHTPDWEEEGKRPVLSATEDGVKIDGKGAGEYWVYFENPGELLFTENETNPARFPEAKNEAKCFKDGIAERVVHGKTAAVNSEPTGTKVAAWHRFTVPAKGQIEVRLRLCKDRQENPFAGFDGIFDIRKQEADLFYSAKHSEKSDEDHRRIQRQAWAGMLWSKQYYAFNVQEWLNDERSDAAGMRAEGRNSEWRHFIAADVISMPDKWEYPWFASWDLAFHAIVFASIDTDFAKNQLLLLLKDSYMHPNGQLPAYEWNFSDVNPPVHAMAVWKVYESELKETGKGDTEFLKRAYHRLLINFTWWVNRKDDLGNNIFEGGFLGLDNIGVFDRSAPIPGGGHLEQADATSWMAMYSLNLMRIAMELALEDPVYEDMAIKFGQHFFYIAGAMANLGNVDGEGLWDEEDGFFYDVMRRPDGSWNRLRLRTIVGLIPLFAVEVIDEARWSKLTHFKEQMAWFMTKRPDLQRLVSHWQDESDGTHKHLLSLLRGHRMKRLLRRMLDENEFLSPHGIRSLSKVYQEKAYHCSTGSTTSTVRYTPAESDNEMFGGNSNWRGPIWMPLNYLIIESLYRFHDYYGDDFKVEYPTGSGSYTTLEKIADEIAHRLSSIFQRDPEGGRPVSGEFDKIQHDPHFKDFVLFYEYFNGDTGEGIGASHQTGWTGLIARLEPKC